MEYLFYSVLAICVAAVSYKLIEEIGKVKWPEPNDPTELIEAKCEIQQLEEQVSYLKKYSSDSDSELRLLQKTFREKIGAS